MERDREQISRMQGGVRAWIIRAGRPGHGLRQVPPPVLLSLLCAAAFGPVLAAAAGVAGAVAVASIGVLSSVGGGVLSDVVIKAIDRLHASGDTTPSPQMIEKAVAIQIEQALAPDDDQARMLRGEIAAVMAEIDAGGTALRAAVETGNEQIRADVVAAIGEVGAGFDEMRFLLSSLEQAATGILESLEGQDAKLRVIIEQNGRQSTDARLTREAVAAIELRTRETLKAPEAGLDAAPRWIQGSPYRGLWPFDETYSEVFYGRERLTAELVGQLAERMTTGGMVIVTGASGAGKSSLLRAGLLPALARGVQLAGSDRWPRIVINPGKHPLTELATHLAALSGDAHSILERLAAHPDQAHLAIREAVLADARRQSREGGVALSDVAPLVLVVDQFEQIFALGTGAEAEGERRTFVTALCAAAGNPGGPHSAPPALVVAAVRGDFWDRCAAYPDLASALQDGQFLVGPMTDSGLRLAITGPADAAGLRVDPGLVDTIMGDLHSSDRGTGTGVLPLLSQAMMLTWENREDGRLTGRGYERTGGVDRAVQVSADAVYDGLSQDQQRVARSLMRNMAAVSRDGQLTRRPVLRADLRRSLTPDDGQQLDEILEAFAGRRLIVLGDGTAEIAHDALLTAWPRLRVWLEDDQASGMFYGQMADDASAWRANANDPSFLYRGTQLAALQQATRTWAQDSDRYPAITSVQGEFLHASTRAAARGARRRQSLGTLLVVLLVAALAGAGIAARSARNASQQSRINLSGKIALESEESDRTDPVTASLLAVAAWRISPTSQARESMLDVLAQPNRGIFPRATGQSAAAFSPNGKILATAGGNVRLWDVATRRQIGAPIATGTAGLGIVAFSPNGKILATVGARVRLWDVATHRQIGAPIGSQTGDANSLAFSPNGKILVTAGASVRFWDVATHQQIGARVDAGPIGAGSVAFSPDGKFLAIAGDDGSIRLLDVATRRLVGRPFSADANIIYQIAFSPDGRTLATASGDGRARLWNAITHKQLGSALAAAGTAGGSVFGVAFSPSGTALATASEDGAARLWDVATHQQLGTPLAAGPGGVLDAVAFSPDGTLATVNQGGAAQLWDAGIYRQAGPPFGTGDTVAFAPGGKTLAIGSIDGTARIWNVANHRQVGASMPTKTDIASPVNDVAFSPDGKTLATATSDTGSSGATVRLWDVATHHQIAALMNTDFDAVTTELAFSPDGRILAAGGYDGKVRLWDVATHRQIGAPMVAGIGFAPKARAVTAVAFSSDGQTLATGSDDGTARLWDVRTGREIHAPLIRSDTTINVVAFSPDGGLLAIGSRAGTVQMWDVATDQPSGSSFTSGDGSIFSEAFTPNGQILATGSLDGQVELWDMATRSQIGTSLAAGIGSTNPTWSVAFSPTGNTLATASDSGSVQLWDTAMPGDLQSAVCSVAGSSLTPVQWKTYIGSEPFQRVCR
jgi:WD40 repeat protein